MGGLQLNPTDFFPFLFFFLFFCTNHTMSTLVIVLFELLSHMYTYRTDFPQMAANGYLHTRVHRTFGV